NQELDIFVPNEDALKVLNFRFKNLVNEDRNIKIILYIKPVLGEDEYLTNGNLSVKKSGNILEIRNPLAEENFKNKIMFITSNLDIASYTGEKDSFFGEGDVLNPDCLYLGLNNKSGFGKNSCVGIAVFNWDFSELFFSLALALVRALFF
ncbi:MAG: hypothetical protein II529_02910, partial [Erysipelotrichaceae bacterium]|nr:hypothetical protein [Erysipelotrichaceae bacterium]